MVVRLPLIAAALAGLLAVAGCGGSAGGSAQGGGESTGATVTASSSTGGAGAGGGTVTTPGVTVAVPGVGTVTVPQMTAGNPVAKGKDVFTNTGCGTCHTFEAAGTTGTTGPNLGERVPVDAKEAGQPVPLFVATSIVAPNTYVAPGYPKDVMPSDYAQKLTPQQLGELVAFISTNAG